MTPEQQQELNQHIQAIAKILHQEAEAEKIQTLEGIETTIREQTLKYITPKLGFFFLSQKRQELKPGDREK